ncbi:MAG TPA: type II toxin-antitoxin system VapB family antitoxin [Fimbriimonadaceae bacterium]|nr:type II toxin-antitoxin system VapB family antitoxin [Fimbriimonadaceae bacterium]
MEQLVEVHRLYGGMALNIKNKEAEALANKLASITGESLTTAVKVALEERLERIQDPTLLERRLIKIAESCASRLGNAKNLDVNELLYDERGLPK